MQDNCIPWQDKAFFPILDDVAQVGIFVFGALAIWFVSMKGKQKRWGYIFGILSQPFWMYSLIYREQGWVFAVNFFYCIGWIIGIINYWVIKDENAK